MGNDHGITDELRHYIEGAEQLYGRGCPRLIAMCDRIDAALAGRYVELPKDTDSEYIHEHDKVDWRDHSGTWHKNALVVAVCSDGCYVMDGMVFHVHASDIRHHKQPTVEDTLHELIGKALMLSEIDGENELVAEYAKRLTLRGDGE